MKLSVIFLIDCLWLCAMGNAQTTAPSPPATTPGSSTQSSANSGATATIINQQGTAARQFITAQPGVFTGVFPGFPANTSDWQLYRPDAETCFTREEIARMTLKFRFSDLLSPMNWRHRLEGVKIGADLPGSPDKVCLTKYWPDIGAHSEDRVLDRFTIIGAPFRPIELFLGLGLTATEKAGSDRVAARIRFHHKTETRGLSFGGGGAASRVTQPGLDNDVVGAATGGLIGTNSVELQEYPELELVVLNKGSLEPPESKWPVPQQKQEAPQASQPAPAQPAITIQVPPQNNEVDQKLIELMGKLIDKLGLPTSPPPPPPTQNVCEGMPQLTTYFDFDKSFVKNEYLPKIQQFAAWLGTHPNCKVQVEGHTCKSGTSDYDAALGRRRALAVYEQLIADGAHPGQIIQFVSGSKDKAASEWQPENRRVILRSIGQASGK